VEYEDEFQLDFMRRTLKVVQDYQGPYDATLLLNSLLGLLIVPKESSLDRIPQDPLAQLAAWGVSPRSIKAFGRCQCGTAHPETLRQLVKGLRNAVAHFRFRPLHHDRKCVGFAFDDRSGFKAELNLEEMRELTERLATHLANELSA